MSNYKSEFKNLGNDFFNKQFNVPIYQRLYVWENIQVKTLISDLVTAYNHNKDLEDDRKKDYYLGGIVVVENKVEDKEIFDLIDGQQRFTTLKILREYLGDTNLKLNFTIRDNVWEHFKNDDTEDLDIKRIKKAKEELIAGLVEIENEKNNFLQYLKEKVKLVVTIVPKESDLNKLFELINGRGEQLQQHEILKAKILSKLDEEEQYKCGKTWEICANMDDFLEINIKKSLGESWKEHTFNENFNSLFNKIQTNRHTEDEENHKQEPTITYIIENSLGKVGESQNIDAEDEANTKYISIISFEMFLLYSLVSFEEINYFDKTSDLHIEFKDKNLIQIFEKVLLSDNTNKFYKFIEHLFAMRVKFDALIIKNHKKIDDDSNETNHKISQVEKYINGDNHSRKINPKEDNSLELLQSMLYHSHTRNTQEWIIPFLKYSDKNNNLELLKKIDNYLYSQIETDNTVLKRASEFKNTEFKININSIITYLSKESTDSHNHISHYWYYKMDWIIWDLAEEKDDKFKFTARNSVEHISPQNPQNENIDIDKVSEKYLNSFGNLFLISGSQNSSVGNEGFKTKISKFFDDKDVKNLKLGLIREDTTWGDAGVEKHLEQCMEQVKKYFEITI